MFTRSFEALTVGSLDTLFGEDTVVVWLLKELSDGPPAVGETMLVG